MRLKALAEIYTMHSFAQLYNLKFLSKNLQILQISIIVLLFPVFPTSLQLRAKKISKFTEKSITVVDGCFHFSIFVLLFPVFPTSLKLRALKKLSVFKKEVRLKFTNFRRKLFIFKK